MWEEQSEEDSGVKSFSKLVSEMHFSIFAPKGSVILLGVGNFTSVMVSNVCALRLRSRGRFGALPELSRDAPCLVDLRRFAPKTVVQRASRPQTGERPFSLLGAAVNVLCSRHAPL